MTTIAIPHGHRYADGETEIQIPAGWTTRRDGLTVICTGPRAEEVRVWWDSARFLFVCEANGRNVGVDICFMLDPDGGWLDAAYNALKGR